MTENYDRTNTKILIGAVVGIAALVAVVFIFCWLGVRATDADRSFRTARAEACRTVEDQALRTLCLVKP